MIPVFGWHVRRSKAIIIDREARAKALRPLVATARSAAAESRPIAIFPDETRTPAGLADPTILEWRHSTSAADRTPGFETEDMTMACHYFRPSSLRAAIAFVQGAFNPWAE
jgi:1-acyl-sn-glycerol-3-phosphate acyltransferase